MRSVLGYAAVLAVAGCGAQEVGTSATPNAIAYAVETDRAIDVAIGARNSDEAYEPAISALRRRTDAAERVVARAEQQDLRTREPYVQLMSHAGQDSDAVRQYLLKLALAKPVPAIPVPSEPGAGHADDRTDHERSLGQSVVAAWALVDRGDTAALSDVYANADINVAAVAAASAARRGILPNDAIQTLNGRGIGGTFQPLSQDVMRLPDVTLGPGVPGQPIEGPQ